MPGATGNYGPTPKRSLADRLDDAAVGMLPLETQGSHFERPVSGGPKVASPAPFAKTARDEVRPIAPPTTMAKSPVRTVSRRRGGQR